MFYNENILWKAKYCFRFSFNYLRPFFPETVEISCYLFSRGKGDYFRLGHGSDSHVRKPQVVEGLKDHKVVDVAVGALHCLAVTEQGQVRPIRFADGRFSNKTKHGL